MRALQALLIMLVVSLVPRIAEADCEGDSDCELVLGAGYTCAETENNGLGVCYAPCQTGMMACGENSRYCITAGTVCCSGVGVPYGCPADHTCGSNRTCAGDPEAEVDGCAELFGCSVDGDGRGGSPIGALAFWGVVALMLFSRRRRQ